MATFKIWIATHLMTVQRRVDVKQDEFARLQVRSNQLLQRESLLIDRDNLRSTAIKKGYREPTQILYVLHP